MVVTAFTHDIGDMLPPPNHDSAAATTRAQETCIAIIGITKAVFVFASGGIRRCSTRHITHWISRFRVDNP